MCYIRQYDSLAAAFHQMCFIRCIFVRLYVSSDAVFHQDLICVSPNAAFHQLLCFMRWVYRQILCFISCCVSSEIAVSSETDVFHQILYFTRYCISPDTVFHQRLYFTRYCVSPDTVFHQRLCLCILLCFTRDCISPDTVFHQILCSTRDCVSPDTEFHQILCFTRYCVPPETVFHQILYFITCCVSSPAVFHQLLCFINCCVSSETVSPRLPPRPVATGGGARGLSPPWKNLSPPRLPALTFYRYRYWGLFPPWNSVSPPLLTIPGYGAAASSSARDTHTTNTPVSDNSRRLSLIVCSNNSWIGLQRIHTSPFVSNPPLDQPRLTVDSVNPLYQGRIGVLWTPLCRLIAFIMTIVIRPPPSNPHVAWGVVLLRRLEITALTQPLLPWHLSERFRRRLFTWQSRDHPLPTNRDFWIIRLKSIYSLLKLR